MRDKTTTAIAAAVVLGVMFSSSAVGAASQQPERCQTVTFNESLLQRFPRAREACLDVIARDGHEYAVFKAKLLKVKGNTARLRPMLWDGSLAPAQSIRFDPERRVLVNGKALHPRQMAVGHQVTAYVRVTEPLAVLAPAEEGAPWELQPIEFVPEEMATQLPAPTMPQTASFLPLIGAAGAMFLALGGGLAYRRRRAMPENGSSGEM